MDEETSIGDWQKVCILGSGSFGVVSLWRHNATNDYVAIKKCRWHEPANIEPKQRARWTQEVEFMRSVQHPNIVAYKELPSEFLSQLERFNLSRLPLLPMEYCGGGNLRRLLTQPQNACGLREPEVRRVLADIAAAVSHLHHRQITHRDIKPENVVLQRCPDGRTIYKLIDLGYAKDMSALMSYVGTLAYTAPEIFKNEPYNHNVDYWSFGIMAYELCCGKHPLLPKVDPFKRFELIGKKSPRDICVYQTEVNKELKIIYTDKILVPNHISACLRTHLEDWLGSMLQYQSAERGRTQTNANVFTVLKTILEKQILHVFAVYNYTHHYYEINAATKLHHLQLHVQESTGLAADDQLIFTSATTIGKELFYKRIDNANMTLFSDLGLSSQSTLYVFKRNKFVHVQKVILPLAVRNLMKSETRKWDQLSVQLCQALHYIEEEMNKMRVIGTIVQELFECLMVKLSAQQELLTELRGAGLRALQMVEFCREMNRECWYDSTKVAAIQNQRKQLCRVRELIENANAASVRHFKAKSRTRLLRISMEKVMSWMAELPINSIYDDALKCLSINKQKAAISADDITPVICRCVKTRKELQQSEIMIQHINLCFKVLREQEKLTRWSQSLNRALTAATADLLDAQKRLSHHDGQPTAALRAESVSLSSWGSVNTLNGHVGRLNNGHTLDQGMEDQDQEKEQELELPTVDDLVRNNRMLRCRLQETLEELLKSHEQHAISVGEFVQFIDSCDEHNIKSTAV